MHNPLEPMNTRTRSCGDTLRQLPAELQPPYNWQEFQRRSQLRVESTGNGANWRYVATAAAFLLVVCAIAIWGRMGMGRQQAGGRLLDSSVLATQGSSASRGPAGDIDALRDAQGLWGETPTR